MMTDKYFKTKLLADNLSNEGIVTGSLPLNSSKSKRKLNLSKIEFRKLDGEINENKFPPSAEICLKVIESL